MFAQVLNHVRGIRLSLSLKGRSLVRWIRCVRLGVTKSMSCWENILVHRPIISQTSFTWSEFRLVSNHSTSLLRKSSLAGLKVCDSFGGTTSMWCSLHRPLFMGKVTAYLNIFVTSTATLSTALAGFKVWRPRVLINPPWRREVCESSIKTLICIHVADAAWVRPLTVIL